MDDARLQVLTDPARIAAVRATGLLDTPRDEAFDRLTRLASVLLDAPFAFVTLVDDHRSFWKSSIGIDSDVPADRENTVEQSFCQYVVASGEPLVVGDVTKNPLTATNPSIEAMGVAAWAGFPFIGPSGHALGSFCVVDTVVREWSERDVETLRVLAAAAAGELALRAALRTAERAAADRHAANERLTYLAEAGQAFAAARTSDGVIVELLRLSVPLLGDWAVAAVVDADGEWTVRGAPAGRDVDAFAAALLHEPGLKLLPDRLRDPAVVTSDATQAGVQRLVTTDAADALRALQPDSMAVLRLGPRGAVLGALAVFRDAGRPAPDEADLNLALGITHRAGMALENLRLVDALRDAGDYDRAVATSLQASMLPRLPDLTDLEVAARYQTAITRDMVGGDWYDVFHYRDGSTVLVIGDVAGHDIAAAAVMGQLHTVLRVLAWQQDVSPSRLLAHLDRAMHELMPVRMVTIAVVRIDAPRHAGEPRAVTWSTAGHLPPVVAGRDGTARVLVGRTDAPIGVLPDRARHDHRLTLSSDETLLLYTDGLIEERDIDIDVRLAALVTAAAAGGALPLEGQLDALLAALGGGTNNDDIALLAARPVDPSRS